MADECASCDLAFGVWPADSHTKPSGAGALQGDFPINGFGSGVHRTQTETRAMRASKRSRVKTHTIVLNTQCHLVLRGAQADADVACTAMM